MFGYCFEIDLRGCPIISNIRSALFSFNAGRISGRIWNKIRINFTNPKRIIKI